MDAGCRLAMVIGIVSDTHGVLPPAAARALRGVEHILHAGDVGAEAVLRDLETIAPVTAVAGNCDRWRGVESLPAVATVTLGGVRFLLIHDICDLREVPDSVDVVVCGHTHRPREERRGRTLVVNPGSATQRRAMPCPTVGRLTISGQESTFELVELPPC